ncbi:hypothetical protein [Photobacterium kishitanii]|uniref:hypothetical protein n=1 Tax=Photobacterium kishitanii TaxID=318456 RepID=UPI0011B20B37|nr:hypothetical protein [Photobacterium kishitanii]
MSEYTTYAVLAPNININVVKFNDNSTRAGFDIEGKEYIVCRAYNAKFASLCRILAIDDRTLKTEDVTYIRAEFWKKYGNSTYNGNDFPLSEISWLNKTLTKWTGSKNQYEDYVHRGGKSYFHDVKYGTFESEYPEFDKTRDSYVKKEPYIIFQYAFTGNDRAGCWENWLGKDAKHGDLDCIIFAKDAAKHFNYKRFIDDFEHAERFVVNAEKFAENNGENLAVMFGFG